MANINFKCPWCNGNKLHQVRRFVTVTQTVESIDPDSIQLGEVDIRGGNAANFECQQCGTGIHLNDKPITEIADLYNVLKTCDWLEEECLITTEK